MLVLKHTSWLKLSIILTTCIFIVIPLIVNAEDSNPQCNDLSLIFLRGSGQNREGQYLNDPFRSDTFGDLEKESYAFFNWHKQHLDNKYPHITYNAISVHDFPGKYSDKGYQAVGVGPFESPDNLANAEFSWIPGDYRDSVKNGIEETVGYIKDQIEQCPDQSYIVGGYSQGAQIVGDSLFQLTESERNKILGVGLFGDPKFIASTGDNILSPIDHHTSFAWRRGTATNNDKGMLEPRFPYVPADLEKKTASYCFSIDMICAGWSGARIEIDSKTKKPRINVAHGTYAANPMMDTVSELVQWASPKLAEYERARGGIASDNDGVVLGNQTDDKARDIMFLLNDGSAKSVVQTFRYDFDKTLYPISGIYPNTMYAAKGFTERESGLANFPHIDTIFSPTKYSGYDPLRPMFSSSNLAQIISKRYPFGQTMYQDGDYPEPTVLAAEKAILTNTWRPDTEKHIVLFTDRVAKDPYKYSICQGFVSAWDVAPTPAYKSCNTGYGGTTWPKTQRSEICDTAYQVITQEQCTFTASDTDLPHVIERTLNDVSLIAQSQEVAVSIVVPYKLYDQYNQYDLPNSLHKLKTFAESTGGKYIYYDQRLRYDSALFSDTLYQIFNNTPKKLTLRYTEPVTSPTDLEKHSVLNATIGQPIVLDVSQSSQSFDSYKWDFNDDGNWDETSAGPVVEHQYSTPTTGFVRIAGVDAGGTIQTQAKLAVAVIEAEEPVLPTPPTVPSITGETTANGEIKLTWETGKEGTLVVIDPESNLPVAQTSLHTGSLTFMPEQPYAELELRVLNDETISDPRTINVTPKPALEVTDDPTICYKLQQCQDESNPDNSLSPQLASTSSLNETQNTPVVFTASTAPSANQTAQQSVQGTSTEATLQEIDSQIEETLNKTQRKKTNYHIQWIGLAIFVLGGCFVLYRLNKMR